MIAVMVIIELLIINTVVQLASGKRLFENKPKDMKQLLKGPLYMLRVAIIMFLIITTYYLLNRMFFVPTEPFLFGFLYSIYYLLVESIEKIIFKEKEIKGV